MSVSETSTTHARSIERLQEEMLAAADNEIRKALSVLDQTEVRELYEMLCYHLGLDADSSEPARRGKRIRPLLATLTAAATGADWHVALPVAAAVELLHNFSLIHDDIQDNSPLRRGRPAVWKKWGIAQAINAGDAMYTLAYQALSELDRQLPPALALSAVRTLQATCLDLTRGQYQDIALETRSEVELDSYWLMIRGKTAALLSASCRLGALSAGAAGERQEAFARFGEALGLAFQARDDLLGIWGDAMLTGKSSESDLLEGKKSLPVVYGLSRGGQFSSRWRSGPIGLEEIGGLAELLEREGARQFTQEAADRLTQQAVEALEQARPSGLAGRALRSLADQLLHRAG